MTTLLADRPHVVYEAWMRDIPLYVGMTCDLPKRLAAHHKRSGWTVGGYDLRTHDCPDRASAEALEARLIGELRPVNNVRGVR